MLSVEGSFGYPNTVDFLGSDSGVGVDGCEIDEVQSLLKMGGGSVKEPFVEDGFGVCENERGSVLGAEGNLSCFHGVDPAAEYGNVMRIQDGFSVGDFVWGKIKTYPWWPGQIYEPSAASESAAEHYEKGKFLVAFSDNTFAWCKPSQLKLFEEGYYEMLKQSKSKIFHTCVEKALSDIRRLLESKMTCRCVREGNQGRPLAENTGIKEGVLVPDMFFNTEFEPADFVSNLKLVARVASSATILDSLILKTGLSAFYSSKGCHGLPEYHEPVPIPGLEDKMEEKLSEVVLDYGFLQVPAQGLFGENQRNQNNIAEVIAKEGDCIDTLIAISRMKGSEVSGHSASPESKISSGNGGGGDQKGAKKRGRKIKGAVGKVAMENVHFSTEKEMDDKSKERNEKGYAMRERKKSKYLSPPYADPTQTIHTGMKHVSLSSSSPYPMNIKLPAKDVLSEIRARALSLYQGDKETHDEVAKFLGMYRSSTYLSGSHFDMMYEEKQNQQTRGRAKNASSQKRQPGRKRKSMSSEPRSLCKDLNQSGSFVLQQERRKRRIGQSMLQGSGSTTLMATFGAACSLPTKSQLIAAYKDFGDVDENETDMYYNNFCARVAFVKSCDAEKALESSQEASPFGTAKVTFKLQYSPDASKAQKLEENSQSKASSVDKQTGNGEASQLKLIEEKLETMTKMVEQSDGKMSSTLKSYLEDEMRVLLSTMG